MKSITIIPSCINHARFGSMSARLAQVAAKAAADALAQPAYAHAPIDMELILRFLTDVHRIVDTVAEFARGDVVSPENAGAGSFDIL